MERLTQDLDDGVIALIEGKSVFSAVKKLYNYEDLEEQGLLVRLPCKLGDVTYWISNEDEDGNKVLTIEENKPITGIAVRKDGVYVSTNNYELGALCKIGSRWALLTREDAERKLKEMEES